MKPLHVFRNWRSASISNRMVLEHFLDVPVLAEVMHGETEMEWPLAD